MGIPIIEVESLSKRYRLGAIGATSLRETLSQWWDRRNGRLPPSESGDFWALRNVSFSVQPGEVVGVLGRNGAGKSTLLKILSRITEPTSGRARIRGRVASLLEVGTGFHPDLTGRENIYINGAILGMTRADIRRRFDDIVAFAEIESFVDTPVKRYSSGMYVRLAFAVAAHLEPEILIIDEVLAVGDASFQKKCLGKMRDVSEHDGRTVIFVSHNLDSVIRLCGRALLLRQGQLVADGPAPEVVNTYLGQDRVAKSEIILSQFPRNDALRQSAILRILSSADAGKLPWIFPFGETLAFRVVLEVVRPVSQLELGFAVFSATGFEIASATSRGRTPTWAQSCGRCEVDVSLPSLRLAPGHYSLNLGLRSSHGQEDFVVGAAMFEVTVSRSSAEDSIDLIRAACVPETDFEFRQSGS